MFFSASMSSFRLSFAYTRYNLIFSKYAENCKPIRNFKICCNAFEWVYTSPLSKEDRVHLCGQHTDRRQVSVFLSCLHHWRDRFAVRVVAGRRNRRCGLKTLNRDMTSDTRSFRLWLCSQFVCRPVKTGPIAHCVWFRLTSSRNNLPITGQINKCTI